MKNQKTLFENFILLNTELIIIFDLMWQIQESYSR